MPKTLLPELTLAQLIWNEADQHPTAAAQVQNPPSVFPFEVVRARRGRKGGGEERG